MKLVDANVLLYAVNRSDPNHDVARSWLDAALGGREEVGFAWIVVLAFLRLVTRPEVFPNPLPVTDAAAQVRAWLGASSAVVVAPTARHIDVLSDLLAAAGTGGNLVSDAHLAALALEHRATVVTFDRDFARFASVRCERPVS